MLKINYLKHRLQFRFAAGTSRGILTERDTFFLKLYEENNPDLAGWGEASPLEGLSLDFRPDFETCIQSFIQTFENQAFNTKNPIPYDWIREHTQKLPALRFALETAWLDFTNQGRKIIFPNAFRLAEKPIPINGLVWMGNRDFMQKQIREKLESGFTCLKMKVGAIDFEQELGILAEIRRKFGSEQIVLRVDANGAFSVSEVLEKLKRLSEFDLHSIEQPIKAGQIEAMASLCEVSPVAIALDEELIGIEEKSNKVQILEQIKPPYIILKPTLLGGLEASREWIEIAEKYKIDWWLTSALESNIGLNSISQFAAEFNNLLPQGLGTGQLYHNNIESPLKVQHGTLIYQKEGFWAKM